MDKKYNFIMTTSASTAQQLIDMGFELVSKSGSQYTFYNKGNEWKQFFDKKDIVPTNILHM